MLLTQDGGGPLLCAQLQETIVLCPQVSGVWKKGSLSLPRSEKPSPSLLALEAACALQMGMFWRL